MEDEVGVEARGKTGGKVGRANVPSDVPVEIGQAEAKGAKGTRQPIGRMLANNDEWSAALAYLHRFSLVGREERVHRPVPPVRNGASRLTRDWRSRSC